MKIKNLIPLLFLAFIMNVNAQLDKNSKAIFVEADFHFLTHDYQKALNLFENLLSVDPGNSNLNFLCGVCCMHLSGRTQDATSYLEIAAKRVSPAYKTSSYKENHAPREAYLMLARAYHINGHVDEAMHTYEIYRDSTDLKKLSEIEFVNRQIESCEWATHMVKNPLKVKFQNVLRDSGQVYSRTNPVLSGNDSIMIYVENNPLNKAIMMTGRKNGKWSKPYKINMQLGATGNFFPVSLSYDGSEMYLVQQDYQNSEIYVSRYVNKRWTRIEKLNKHINTKYYETHASISRDGNSLYFTSDRKGGFGGLDIYLSRRDSSGIWGEAVNLGPAVNTIYNEASPFITKNDSKLYFSSEGHQTMGGYDIFISERNAGGTWSSPENIGYPVSSTDDDLFYNPGWNDRCGYYSWGFREMALKNIKIINIIPDDRVAILNPSLIIEKETDAQEIIEKPQKVNPEIDAGLSNTGAYITLNNILFDFNSYTLNERAIKEVERINEVMQEVKYLSVELTGHTDSRGSVRTNMRISRLRAQSVANYLTEKGIDPGRITVRGCGESSPVAINHFSDGSDAASGRKFNRHTSIKFKNLSDERVRVAEMLVPERLKPVHERAYAVLLTENKQLIKKMPEKFFGKKISLVRTEGTNFYIAEKFDSKTEAARFLNEAIDYGFPEAILMQKDELARIIGSQIREENSSQLTYTIQIMALKESRDVSHFSDLGLVMKYTGEDGFHRYTSGRFYSYEEAERELSYVRQKGYRNAFVIPVSGLEKVVGPAGSSAFLTQKL